MNTETTTDTSLARFLQRMNSVQVDIEHLHNATQDMAVDAELVLSDRIAQSVRKEAVLTVVTSKNMRNATQDRNTKVQKDRK